MSRLVASCLATIVLSTVLLSADDVKSTVARLNEAWQSAYKAADSNRLASLYAEDALVMAPGGEPLQGRKAIQNFFAYDFKDFPKHSLTTKSLRVEACGTLLVDSGEYKYDGISTEGKPVHIMGNYITTFKKTDGNWHTAIEIWNVRPPEEATDYK
jgi:uncharacterized protein (TIGR02246 family)